MHVPQTIPNVITDKALKAATNFVETCNQHLAFLSGRGLISDAIETYKKVSNYITDFLRDVKNFYHASYDMDLCHDMYNTFMLLYSQFAQYQHTDNNNDNNMIPLS